MYNKIILVGNLTRDIELKNTQAGMAIANTAIATSRKFTSNGEKKEEVCFVDITFFGRSAEVANQYLHKGSKILVEGRLKFEQWDDHNNKDIINNRGNKHLDKHTKHLLQLTKTHKGNHKHNINTISTNKHNNSHPKINKHNNKMKNSLFKGVLEIKK